MTKIKTAWLTTNRTCNCQCEWCYARNASAKDMELSDAKKIVESLEANEVKNIILIGGEPTLYPYLTELMEYIVSKGIRVSLTTNGHRFSSEDFTKAVARIGISGVNVSLKGVTQQDYSKNTGNDNGFRKTLEGIRLLKENNIPVALSYVIADNNTENIEILYQLVLDEEIENVMFQFEKPVVSTESAPVLPISEMAKMAEYIFERFDDTSINYMLEMSFPFCAVRREILKKMVEKKRVMSGCHIQEGSGIVFDTRARVLPCNHFIDLPFVDRPVLSCEAIADLWKSEEVQSFRKKTRCYPSLKCKDCDLWDACGGGCFTRWLYLDPDTEIVGGLIK